MNENITRERLLELGSSLQGIVQELLDATPAPNPRKRKKRDDSRVAKHLNILERRTIKK